MYILVTKTLYISVPGFRCTNRSPLHPEDGGLTPSVSVVSTRTLESSDRLVETFASCKSGRQCSRL